jgi:phosphoglycerol transferase MdoB-like AlkP superfamily enzyme
MADEKAAGTGLGQTLGAAGWRVLRRLAAVRLGPLPVWSCAALTTIVIGGYYWRFEGTLENILFTAGVTLAIAGALALLSRSVLLATAVTSLLVAIIVWASSTKREIMNMVAHAYDLVFYLSSWSTVSYLWSDHRRYVVGLGAALALTAGAGWLAWRIDGARIGRRRAAIATALFTVVAAAGAQLKEERRHMQFRFENLYVSSFFASWSETLETLWRGQLVEAAASSSGPRLALPTACETVTKPPHIVLIHQESIVPPSLFPTLAYDRSVDPMFRSFDGRLHKLRVETYGGASWLTEFSILAGVSTHSFGGMRQFVQTVMENRIRDTLPQALERCGYRNVVFYPMLKNFVSNARFYQSVGLKEIFDLNDQGAKSASERDRFYYSNALAELERHLGSSSKPLFTFIQTMSGHWPYDITFMPDVDVPGGGPGTHPELNEYLRRIAMARMDYAFLVAELRRRFPGERFLIVQYGDHQPTATRLLLGFKEETEAEDVAIVYDSPSLTTYYAVDGINYQPPPLPDHETLDVPYLGMVLLDAARLPLSDANRERRRLMAVCEGRYYGCRRRDEILAFHRRLIDSGLMDAR